MSVFRSALKTACFLGGLMAEGFEDDFVRFCDTKYCIGVGSGTDALRFALIASGSFPVTETAASSILSLPMGPSLTKSQIERVSKLICRFMART